MEYVEKTNFKKKMTKKKEKKNRYFGKKFSILGDSISTLEGFIPKKYRTFYAKENAEKTMVLEMFDTWWGQVIDYFGGELLVNNSWSGSRVTKLQDSKFLFPSGCSKERTSGLHINSVMPDVILVFLGFNDWAQGIPFKENIANNMYQDSEMFFDFAYDKMLLQLKHNYPNADVWCCTLCKTYISNNPGFVFPYEYAGIHIEKYNRTIKTIAGFNGCKIIDFAKYNKAYDTVDGTHPNAAGMQLLAHLAITEIKRKSITKNFLLEK